MCSARCCTAALHRNNCLISYLVPSGVSSSRPGHTRARSWDSGTGCYHPVPLSPLGPSTQLDDGFLAVPQARPNFSHS